MKALLVTLSTLSLLFAGALGLHVLLPPDLERYEDTSKLVLADDDSILRAFISRDGMWRFPASYNEVDEKYIEFLLEYQDKRYWSHFRQDPFG